MNTAVYIRKKSAAGFLYAILMGCFVLPASAKPAHFITALEQNQKQTIVVYGTSLTANSAWPGTLTSTLKKKYGGRVKMINAAKGGMDSRWGLTNVSNRVIRKQPDVVFIEFTINDALQASLLSVRESLWNLKTMIGMIHAERPGCEIILMIMSPPTGEPFYQRPHYQDYAAGYRQLARKNKWQLIDFTTTWQQIIKRTPTLWNSYAPDGLHPTPQAARDVILPKLLKEIGFSHD